jgi:hypothetical protein
MYGDYHLLDPKHISNLKEEISLDSSGVDADFILDKSDPTIDPTPDNEPNEPFQHLIDDIESEVVADLYSKSLWITQFPNLFQSWSLSTHSYR